MRARIVVAVALMFGATQWSVAGASVAATHNCGHLIVDPRGNAYEFFLPTKPYNPEADLLTLDAVTTSSKVVFTVKMASVNPTPTTGTEVGIYFTADHQGGSTHWLVGVNHEIDATTYVLQNQDTLEVVDLTGSVDPKAGTYTIEVPRADIDAKFRGAMLKELGVITSQDIGTSLAYGGFIEQSTGPEFHYRVGYAYGCRK